MLDDQLTQIIFAVTLEMAGQLVDLAASRSPHSHGTNGLAQAVQDTGDQWRSGCICPDGHITDAAG